MSARIDSRLLFHFLYKTYETEKNADVYNPLHLDHRNNGPHFKEGLNGKCWWPPHDGWFYNLVNSTTGEISDYLLDDQKFPLDESTCTFYEISQSENSKDSKERIGKEYRFKEADVHKQLTFESKLYNVLYDAYETYYGKNLDAFKGALLIECNKLQVSDLETNCIANENQIEYMISWLITTAKGNRGKPLNRKPVNTASITDEHLEYYKKKSNRLNLAHLRSILEGSQPNQPCWAEELCKSYGLPDIQIPSALCDCMTLKSFENDSDFLNTILPRNLLCVILPEADSSEGIADLMQGIHSDTLRRTICKELQRTISKDGPSYLIDDLLKKCKSLDLNENQFCTVYEALFKILGQEGERLPCYLLRCQTPTYPYIGIAMLIVYALLGSKYFYYMFPNEIQVIKFFHR